MKTIIYLIMAFCLLSGKVLAEEGHGHEKSENLAEHHDDHGEEHSEKEEEHHGDEHDDPDHEEEGHEDEHGTGGHDDHGEESSVVNISSVMLEVGEIKVVSIKPVYDAQSTIYAPGEIVNNQYQMNVLSVQLDSKVMKRHVVLGEHVAKGQVIATLFSNDMAELQQSLMLAGQEWKRVKTLGKKTVGDKRFAESLLAFESSNSQVQAAGMSQKSVTSLLSNPTKTRLGEYQIVAPFDGVVLNDDFQQGQFLSAGDSVADIVNEDELWVDVLVAPKIGQVIPLGSKATVKIEGKSFHASVIQESHAIDEVTRTRKIRLSLDNHDHLLHSGQFVDVYLSLPIEGSVILIPESALMRSSDGDWTVFVESEPGQFTPQEVTLINTSDNMHVVEGLKPGQRIAIEGAFFVASELAKGGFDPHNH